MLCGYGGGARVTARERPETTAMEMQQVRYFLAVCEELNFTRAAEKCHVAQPSLTRAIKLLEDELGGPLFHRERNNTHLSELGNSVRPFLEEVYQRAPAGQGSGGRLCRAEEDAAQARHHVHDRPSQPRRAIDQPASDLSRDRTADHRCRSATMLHDKLLDGKLEAASTACRGSPTSGCIICRCSASNS